MKLFGRSRRDPLWKEEFSVFSEDERYVSRRQFAKFLVLTSFAMFVGNVWLLIKSLVSRTAVYPRQAIAALSDLAIGEARTFAYPTPEDHCILVRTGARQYAAFSQKCTHLSCAVYFSKEENALVCPCHKGYFSALDGTVLQGPPPRPLPRILIEQQGDQLIATGVQAGVQFNDTRES